MPKFIWSSPHLAEKVAKSGVKTLAALFFYSLSFLLRKESNAITVLATVAIQVTTAIANSKVISKPPKSFISANAD